MLGSFVIAGTVLMLASIVFFASTQLGRDAVAMETYFTESVTGLDVGSPVRFRGVKVGEVRRISEVAEKYDTGMRYVLVEVSITSRRLAGRPLDQLEHDIGTAVGEGLRVYLATQGLTGIAYLETDFFEPAKHPPLPIDWQPDVPHVPSAPSRLKNLADSLDAVLSDLRRTDVSGTVEHVKKTLEEIRSTAANFDAAAVSAQAKETMASFRQVADESSERLRRVFDRTDSALERLDATFAEEHLGNALRNFEQVSEDAGEAVRDLRALIGRAENTVREASDLMRRPRRELDDLLANLREASRQLANLGGLLERYPSLLLFGEKPSPVKLDK
jgi:ABC-type transporter Mla subunit MlaD